MPRQHDTPSLFDAADPAPRLGDVCANRHRGAPGSVAANAIAEPHKAASRTEVYTEIRRAGTHGMTVDEIAVKLGKTPNQISPRVTELRSAKYGQLVRSNGRTRTTRTRSPAAVWVAVEFVPTNGGRAS
jgi:hypothetical protein